MTDNTLSKLLFCLMLLLTAGLLSLIVFCIFKFGFISTLGWCTLIYIIFFALGLFMRDFVDREIGVK
jgi:hypothetical protein